MRPCGWFAPGLSKSGFAILGAISFCCLAVKPYHASVAGSGRHYRISEHVLITVTVTLLSLFLAVALAVSGQGSPAAVAHLAFAIGIVPLIFAAMIHFVPVLTRTGEPARWVGRLPWLAQAVGGLIVLSLQGILPYHAVFAGALLAALLTSTLLVWIVGRARKCLGTPHPGWRWYVAALALLLAALAAVLLMPLLPAQWASWRLLHLHLNTLGLLGLAAFGTLPLLLPTALGQADPQAAPWLSRKLWPLLAGVLLVAVGAAFYWPLAVAGSAILLAIVLGLPLHWWRHFGRQRLVDGVATGLIAAVAGFSLSLVAGNLHAAGLLVARPALAVWAAGFLLPLVTSALAQLLPVWRWPGPKPPGRDAMRACLLVGAHWRAAAFLAAAVLILAGFNLPGAVLLCAALAGFGLQLLRALRIART